MDELLDWMKEGTSTLQVSAPPRRSFSFHWEERRNPKLSCQCGPQDGDLDGSGPRLWMGGEQGEGVSTGLQQEEPTPVAHFAYL